MLKDTADLTSIKLIDFGISTKYDDTDLSQLSLRCGTLLYMAPEVLLKQEYGKGVDIWSLGVTMYQLIAGQHPLRYKDKLKDMDTYRGLLEARTPIKYSEQQGFTRLSVDLMKRMLEYNPVHRFKAEQVARHPWIT